MKPLRTILLVEDDPNDRLLFMRAVKKADITDPVQFASDGQAAIDYLSGAGEFADRVRHPAPDLVVLDLRLPLATGFEVLTALRQNVDTRHLPVVVLSSSPSSADIAHAYALGANGYLVKPSSSEDLLSLVLSLKSFWLTHNHSPLPGGPSAELPH